MINIVEFLISKKRNKVGTTVIATNDNLRGIVKDTIRKEGNNADLNFIDTSKVTDMYALFEYSNFYGDISEWDVSNVRNMSSMFYNVVNFNCDISGWDVSSVENFESMFQGARRFNQPIGKWNTESAKNMIKMFYWAENFNQNLSNWNVDNVENHTMMFSCCPMGLDKKVLPNFKD